MALGGMTSQDSMPGYDTGVFRELISGSAECCPQLDASQQLLIALMDSLSAAVFWKDLSSTYIGANQAFADLADMSVDEMVGKTDAEMPWAKESKHYTSWDSRIFEEGRPISNIRETITNARGEEIWISTNKAPLFDTDGDVIGLVGTFRDITQEVLAETESHRTMKDLDQRVTERTEQLLRANQSLRKEVDERVRLQAEERQLRDYADIRREIGASMSRTLDLERVLEVLVGGVQNLITNDLVAIVLANAGGELEVECLEAAFGYEVADAALLPGILDEHASLLAPGTPVGASASGHMPTTFGPARSTIAAEMITGGELIGYIVLESRWSDFYVAEHGERLSGLAEQASAVISYVRLTQQASELAAAAERDRLRRDLHDSVVQTLAAAALTVDAELIDMAPDDPARPAFERIQRLSADANTEIRALLREMRSGSLAKIDLVDLVVRFANRPDWPFSVDVKNRLSRPNDYTDITHGLFRIVQESLNNASKHADAERVVIELDDNPDQLRVSISDDGIGFDSAPVGGDHLGLSIMAERAEEFGGELTVRSAKGHGTTVELTLQRKQKRTASMG